MIMDIATPAELLRFEQADYGDGRRQAYLTFLNESYYAITAISGRMQLMDDTGAVVSDSRVSFGDLMAAPGKPFTCHLALDGYPGFAEGTLIVEDVLFDGADAWALHPTRLRDYTPDILPEGPERNALVAIAGHDAVCYPAAGENIWVCVCGRFNRRRWPVCRRCRRERDATLADYTPEKVAQAYALHVSAAQKKPPRVVVDGRPKKALPPEPKPQKPRGVLANRIAAMLAGLALVIVLAYGAYTLFTRLPDQILRTAAGSHSVDYLEPIR